jgi:hypothetical protein
MAEAARLEAEAACQEDERQRQHVERTRGGGGVTKGVTRQPACEQEANGRGGVCRQEAMNHSEDKKRQRRNERHHDNQLEALADKRQRCLESRRHLEMMRGGACAARGQENEVACRKDDRGGWMRRNKRQHDNQPRQTREVKWSWTPRLAVGRQEAEEEGYLYQAVECVFDKFALLDFML